MSELKMEPFVDSTDIVDDGPALAGRMERDGYLFIRGLLPVDTVLDLRRQLLELAAEGGWLAKDQPIEAGIADPAAACCDPEPGYTKVFKNLWKNEDLHALKHHPAIIGILEHMLGEEPFPQPLFVERNVFPQGADFDFTTRPHQDVVHVGGRTHAVWSPIGDCPIERGPICMAAGSHRNGVLDFRVVAGPGGMEMTPPDECPWHGGSFSVGDVVIFSDNTVHQALPNRTLALRQSFDARYQLRTEPITAQSVRPYGNILTWEQVYADWESTEYQYYWEKLDLDVVPFDMRYYDKRDAIAFEMAERGERAARDTLLRIVQRDPDVAKRERATCLIQMLDS